MRYNIRTLSLLIVIFGLLSIGISQSFFNRLTGSDPYISSGRAFAMGGTSHSENSTHLLLLNPAGLWRLGSGLSFELHQGGSSILERRGFCENKISCKDLCNKRFMKEKHFHDDCEEFWC